MTSPPAVGERDTRPALTRSRENRVVAGVAGGLGEYLDVDPIWFRIAFVALALGGGAGVLLYLIGWLAIPEAAPGSEPAAVPGPDRARAGLVVVGGILIMLGTISIVGRVAPWMSWLFWPAVLVTLGAVLIMRGVRR